MKRLLTGLVWFAVAVTGCAGLLVSGFSLSALREAWKIPASPPKVSVSELAARGAGADRFVLLQGFAITGCVVMEEEMAGHRHARPTGRWAEVLAVAVPADGPAPRSITIVNDSTRLGVPSNGVLIRSNQVHSKRGLQQMARRGVLARLEGRAEVRGPAGSPVRCPVVREVADVGDWRSYALRLGLGLGLVLFAGAWAYRAVKSGESW